MRNQLVAPSARNPPRHGGHLDRTYYAQGSQEAIPCPQMGRIRRSERCGHRIGDQACAFEAQTWIEIEGTRNGPFFAL